LSRFDFVLKHVADRRVERENSLSKRADWAKDVEKDNEN